MLAQCLRKTIIRKFTKEILLITILYGLAAYGCDSSKSCAAVKAAPVTVAGVLRELNKTTELLETYQVEIEYLFKQPLFDSQSLKKGTLYFRKDGEGGIVRVNFVSLKQDEDREQKYREDYIFDGRELTVIDYQMKFARTQQISEGNSPADPFEAISRKLPLIGFSKTEKLKEDFEIELLRDAKPGGERHHLRMRIRQGSVYKDDYVSIDFWIDKKMNLPVKISAVSTEEDIYEITFKKALVNKKMNKNIFKIKLPIGFEKETIPLRKKR